MPVNPEPALGQARATAPCDDSFRTDLSTRHLRHILGKLQISENDLFISWGLPTATLAAHGWDPCCLSALRSHDYSQSLCLLHKRGCLAEDPARAFGSASECGAPICALACDVLGALPPIRCILSGTYSSSSVAKAALVLDHRQELVEFAVEALTNITGDVARRLSVITRCSFTDSIGFSSAEVVRPGDHLCREYLAGSCERVQNCQRQHQHNDRCAMTLGRGMSSSSHREPKAVLVEQRVALVQQQMKSAKEEVLGHAQTLLLMRGNRDDETELKGPTTFSQVFQFISHLHRRSQQLTIPQPTPPPAPPPPHISNHPPHSLACLLIDADTGRSCLKRPSFQRVGGRFPPTSPTTRLGSSTTTC